MSLLSRLAVQAARAYGVLSSKNTNVPASYLVVAGGGGGGFDQSGGGGAGGLLASTATLSTLNTYSITIGAGGNGSSAGAATGSSGANSVISGTGLSTITSTGGGGGGSSSSRNGVAGGSGGGASGYTGGGSGGTGISGQGNKGGDAPSSGASGTGAGGGGAGAAGADNSSNIGTAGGIGSTSSISGTSTYYAGGGGGSIGNTTSRNAGGLGGGGASANNAGGAVSGTANTGGGGGASSAWGGGAGGSGGSGIVIIAYTSATPLFVGGTLTTSGGNQIHTFTSSGTLSPITPVTASYLVVAGGGSGSTSVGFTEASGGGGAGGLLSGSTTIYSGATYVVTVGAGGAGPSTYAGTNNGSNSVLSGTGLTTLTSIGGGAGHADSPGVNGGSGGAGGAALASRAGGTGTAGQGNNGGSGFGSATTSVRSGGGGGGSGAVGANATSGQGGAGGAGTASSITGTSVTYAAGGGGSSQTAGGSGGSSVGGNGQGLSPATSTTSGIVNTGSGGGAAVNTNGGSGGSGIVIISYAGSQVFNGGLVTSSGGNTIHTFNATGALTPLTNNLTNSLRFRASASAYLSRTPTLATNRRTWTLSMWIKRGSNFGSQSEFFTAGTSGSNYLTFQFDTSNRLALVSETPSLVCELRTTSVYRDPAAWYHITLAVDTTQATSANRLKLYVNGNQVTAFATATYPTQNTDLLVNSAVAHYFSHNTSGGGYFDGYDTNINFIDGQALEPYYFGNNDAYGNWKPILYKGMYGTNGFYLTFADTSAATAAAIGKDSSGNGNNWTPNNISVTAGVTYDAMLDVPTNTSATVANYCTWNPLTFRISAATTFSNANLTSTFAGGGYATAYGTIAVTSGKYYWEVTVDTVGGDSQIGISEAVSIDSTSAVYRVYRSSGQKQTTGNVSSAYGSSYTTSDIIGVALDIDSGTITFYKNNTSQGTAFTDIASALPSTGWTPYGYGYSGNVLSANFGQRPFTYTAPSGFVALNTYNLPTPTILQGNKYMDATAYVATGTAPQTVVNAGQFKPDLVWTKNRTSVGNHYLNDSVRGAANALNSNTTSAEASLTNYITSFNSNGYGIGSDNFTSGQNVIGWQWQAGQGSTSSNTSGSITSTVSVNTTAGFSVATFTGNGTAGATIGHGLGVAPKMIIVKSRSASGDWWVYHASIGATKVLFLSLTDAELTFAAWNNTAPTSSVFTIGSAGGLNVNSVTQVAYCWAEIAGFSKFGSYTGNGSTDGPFVYLGFRPKYVMVKPTSTTGSWQIEDTSRSPTNVMDQRLFAEDSAAETVNGNGLIDYLSNGFKPRVNHPGNNGSGVTYIYMAFAENPFNNSNAR